VTAVGEVPAVTVQAIATGVTKEPDTAASALVPAPEARSPR